MIVNRIINGDIDHYSGYLLISALPGKDLNRLIKDIRRIKLKVQIFSIKLALQSLNQNFKDYRESFAADLGRFFP